MKRTPDQNPSQPETPISRRDMLTYAVLGAVAGTLTTTAQRELSSPPIATYAPRAIHERGGDKHSRMLNAFVHGYVADVQKQTKPLIPTALGYGDVVMFDDAGNRRYDADVMATYIAEQIATEVRKRNYAVAVFNAISLGGIPVEKAVKLLQANRTDEEYSTRLQATFIDCPADPEDLFDYYGVLAHAGRLPRLNVLNRWYNPEGTPGTAAQDQSESILDHPTPLIGSLELDAFALWQSKEDKIVRASAGEKWLKALRPGTPTMTVRPSIGHAGIEQAPSVARRAFNETTNWHIAQI